MPRDPAQGAQGAATARKFLTREYERAVKTKSRSPEVYKKFIACIDYCLDVVKAEELEQKPPASVAERGSRRGRRTAARAA